MMKVVSCLLISLGMMSTSMAQDKCVTETLRQAAKYAEIVNTASRLQGGKVNLLVHETSLRRFNEHEYAVQLSSDHGGAESFFARELVLAGRPSMLSCKVSELRVYRLRLITPGSTEWEKLLFASHTGI